MKTIAILCFVFALFEANLINARLAADEPELTAEESTCVAELNFNRTIIQQQNNLERAPENDSHFAKFLSCYYKKMGWQTKDGLMDFDKYNEALLEATLSEIQNEDPVIKMGVRYIAMSFFSDCESRVPPNMVQESQVVWLQNCIVDKLTSISQRRK